MQCGQKKKVTEVCLILERCAQELLLWLFPHLTVSYFSQILELGKGWAFVSHLSYFLFPISSYAFMGNKGLPFSTKKIPRSRVIEVHLLSDSKRRQSILENPFWRSSLGMQVPFLLHISILMPKAKYYFRLFLPHSLYRKISVFYPAPHISWETEALDWPGQSHVLEKVQEKCTLKLCKTNVLVVYVWGSWRSLTLTALPKVISRTPVSQPLGVLVDSS